MKRSLDVEPTGPRKQVDVNENRKRELTTVIVRNLSKSYNQTKLRKYFQDCGRINQVDVCEALSKDGRLARIEFTSYNEVLTALTKTFSKIGNNEIQVEPLVDCTIWMTNFPPQYTARDIINLLRRIDILTVSVRLPSLRFNANRRFAYVDLTSQDDVNRAVSQLNDKTIQSYRLVVKKSNLLDISKRTDSAVLERREIMIRHLNLEQITEDRLKEIFSTYGAIETVKVPHTGDRQHTDGYAFITFKEKSSADESLKADQTTLDGQQINVKLSDRKEYLERQKVKRILFNKSQNDSIISLFPLSDHISKAQIESLLTEKLGLNANDMENLYLVSDYEGALIVLKEAKLAAKCLMSLNGTEFKGRHLHCGTVRDLKDHDRNRKATAKSHFVNASRDHFIQTTLRDTNSSPKLSNEDFRKIFLNK